MGNCLFPKFPEPPTVSPEAAASKHALKPEQQIWSGKDGLFPALLGKNGAWLMLGIRMVG